MNIATCSYAKYTETMGVPVRLSYPAAPPGFAVRFQAPELTPDGHMRLLSFEDFTRAYLRKLDAFGITAAGHLLRGIRLTARADDATPLVLLTHEDLTRPGEWSHRTILASWITEHTGHLVPELGGVPAGDAYAAALVEAPTGVPAGGTDEAGTTAMF